MTGVDLDALDKAFDSFAHLTGRTFTCNGHAAVAAELATASAPLADLAAALGVKGAASEVAAIRRSAAAVQRHAGLVSRAASAATAALQDGVPLHTRPVAPRECRRISTRVHAAFREVMRSLESTHRHAAVAGRLAAGFAAVHEPDVGPEPLWNAALRVLAPLPVDAGTDRPLILSGNEADRRAMAGALTQVRLNQPAFLTAKVDDGRGRYIQLMFDDAGMGCVLLESVGDDFLEEADAYTDAEHDALKRLGFAPPDDEHLNWNADDDDVSVTHLADVVLSVLAEVHGAQPGDAIRLSVALASHHPANELDSSDHPAVLAVDSPDVESIAEALASRLGEAIDTIGVDQLWVTVSQPGSAYFAHLGSNGDGALFTEVTGDFYLDLPDRLSDRRRGHLRALGWEDPIDDDSGDEDLQPRNHTRVWPAPFDVEAAAWHVVLTLVAVYDVDPDKPVLAEVDLFS